MYILDNTDYHLDYFDIENYELNIFQILQNFWSYIDDVDYGAWWINRYWLKNRHKEELYMLCTLCNEDEYIDLTLVLTEIEQKNDFYKTGAHYDEKRYMNLLKRNKKRGKKKKKKGKRIFYINIF